MPHDLIPIAQRDDWNLTLSGLPHGFGHTWESCHAYWLTVRLPTYLYVFDGDGARIICPLVVRHREGYPDVTTPFGFSGFAGTGYDAQFRNEWYAFARSQGWICAYIGQNPLLQPERFWDPGEFEQGQNLYWLDLQRSDEELFSRLSRGRRYQVRRWTAAPGWLCTDRQMMVQFILDNHEGFFRRVGASTTYRLSDETWRVLARCPNVELIGATTNGQLVAIMLFGVADGLADALFNISVPEGRDAATALMMEGAHRLRSMGVQILNMGGGAKAGDSVENAKRQFDAHVTPLLRMKQVFDEQQFGALCRSVEADSSDVCGYFPPYHK